MVIEQLTKNRKSHFQRISVKSALNPALFLAAITLTGGIAGLVYFSSNILLTIFFMCVIAVPIICVCIAFIYFTFFHPELLRSEECQLKLEQYRMLRYKGGFREINPELLKVINNPVIAELGPRTSEEEK
jgi:ABC-type siderophore export system fused ATPase/permease subunit